MQDVSLQNILKTKQFYNFWGEVRGIWKYKQVPEVKK